MGNIVWLKNAISITAWNTASNWAFWNEETQQIEDYGRAPNGDDYVYLNSYIVTAATSTLSFPNGTITNKPNPYTGLTGGRFDNGSNDSNCTIISNLEVGETYMLRHAGNGHFTFNITGNIVGSNSAVVYNKGGNNGGILKVIGNIYGGSQPLMSGNTGSSLNIVGDVYLKNGVGSNVTNSLKISGSLHLDYTTFTSVTVTTLDTEGDIYLTGKKLGSCTTWINRGASIYYKGLNPLGGFCNYTNLDLRYPDDFVVKDIDEPRVNPLVIETNWDFANEVQYPNENRVVAGTPYAFDEKVGTFAVDYPPESVVLNGYVYDNGEKVGSMSAQAQVGCVTPEDVRKDVPLVGMGVVGSLVVPSADDVREGVVFDNGSVGTLIVQGGGDRLKIADFGYYTNAQSDTYIVDLTEQDKPKFAVAEERVLIEMFPDLDLENIPEKYFDDLFVKYLKYRLIVEYYRTAGINSTFTPSEPTTEIVNYQNVRNEVWLNSANIYLKSWARKYPESIVKPQRILL